MKTLFRHILIPSVLFLTFVDCSQAARVLAHYDLKQLGAMATLIVKAEVRAATEVQTRDGDCAVWNVKIVATFKGEAEVSSEIRVAGIEEYHKGPGIKGVGEGYPRLAKGDIVFLFLVPRDTPMGYAKYNLTDAGWKVIESGTRLISDNQVYDFGQLFSPDFSAGPISGFVVMSPKTFPKCQVFSVPNFEEELKKSVQGKAPKTGGGLDGKSQQQTISRLTGLPAGAE